MFNINIDSLEAQLTELFQPLTEMKQLIDKEFQGNIRNETKLDFMLKLLIRLTEIFGSKSGLRLNGGTLK